MESGRRRPEAPARWGRTSARRLLESARPRTCGSDVRGFFAKQDNVGATVHATRQGTDGVGSRFVCMRGRESAASICTETVADQIMRNSGRVASALLLVDSSRDSAHMRKSNTVLVL